MDEFAPNGATVYKSAEVKKLLAYLNMKERVSPANNPLSSTRAEGAAKDAKRMIRDSTRPSGTCETNKYQAAQLVHRNRPNPATKLYNSKVIFGRKINDLLLFAAGKLKSRP